MTIFRSVLVVVGVLSTFRPYVLAQAQSDPLSLRVMFMERAGPADESRLWLVIRNGSIVPHMLCKRSWGYSLIPDDLNQPPYIRDWTSVHGCGDDEHDAFWALLPGQSRFDSIQIETPASHAYDLDVSVDLNENPLGSEKVAAHRALQWKGRLSEAIELFEQLKSGRFR